MGQKRGIPQEEGVPGANIKGVRFPEDRAKALAGILPMRIRRQIGVVEYTAWPERVP